MNKWPDQKILNLLAIELPIIQAPMAGHQNIELAIAVARAGGLGSLPCATIDADMIRNEVKKFRTEVPGKPVNLNFFCHNSKAVNDEQQAQWKKRLDVYYKEFEVDPEATAPSVNRKPFDENMCNLVCELKPEIVSFHFGLPDSALIKRLKKCDIKILSSATTVDEAIYLEKNGCDAVIAQGFEAGGHRAIFQSMETSTQVGTMALVPQIADAIKIPVIASGGISDARGIAAAFILGASAVQMGTAYLFSDEAKLSASHKTSLQSVKDNQTVITNVFSGRPARGIENRLTKEVGPISHYTPDFPHAGIALALLKSKAEKDFSSLWSGQAARLCKTGPAEEITKTLAAGALKILV